MTNKILFFRSLPEKSYKVTSHLKYADKILIEVKYLRWIRNQKRSNERTFHSLNCLTFKNIEPKARVYFVEKIRVLKKKFCFDLFSTKLKETSSTDACLTKFI